jgi:hypothetical protein
VARTSQPSRAKEVAAGQVLRASVAHTPGMGATRDGGTTPWLEIEKEKRDEDKGLGPHIINTIARPFDKSSIVFTISYVVAVIENILL